MNNINRELISQCEMCHKEIYHNDKIFKLVNDYQLIGKPSNDLFFCNECSFYKTLSFKQLFFLFLNSSIYFLILSSISAWIASNFNYNIFDKINKENKHIWNISIGSFILYISILGFLIYNKYENFIGIHERREE